MAKLVKQTGNEKPELMTIKYNDDNIIYASINVHIIENTDGTYEWDELIIPEFALNKIHNATPKMKYKVLLIHILRAYYDDNDATAILSNYLSNPTDEKYKIEFDELQKCRTLAKNTAKEIIDNNIF